MSWELNDVIEVRVVTGRTLFLRFDDGVSGEIDLSLLYQEGTVFEPLKDEAMFNRVYIEGGTIAWPCGADIAPESLYTALDPLKDVCRRKHSD